MKIVQPYAVMKDVHSQGEGIEMLRRVEYIARVSHRSEEAQTSDSWDRFLRSIVLQHGDWSVVEHEKVTCEFLVDRGITHEIVRHRIGSYTQESTRFVNYSKPGHGALFIKPPYPISQEDQFGIYPHGLFSEQWHRSIDQAEESYKTMVESGIKPQIARSVFPNALASKIIVTYNLRSWRHFFIMRTSAQAHPQMREVVDPLLWQFQECIPILYEDIIPGEQQAIAMRKAR